MMSKKKWKKIFIYGVAAIAGVIAIGIITTHLFMGTTVETTEIEPQTAELRFTETGIVKSQGSIDVFPLVSGEIVRIDVQESQQVRQGDIILVVDSTELENQIRQIGAQDNRAAIAAQEVVVNQRRNERSRAEENHQRMATLYQAGAITEIEYQNAAAALEDAGSALDGANAQLAVIRAGLAGAQSQIAALQSKIQDSTVRAPIDGTISSLNVQGMNVVTQTAPVARITAADTPSEIEVFVSTRDISHVRSGDRVNITFADRVQNVNIDGDVLYIDSRAQSVISALGISEQRVRVTIGFDHAMLREGFAVDVDFILYRAENKLIVPKSAVFQQNGDDRVFVVRNGRAQPVAVEKGIELRTGYVIESGLIAGDIVINDANVSGLRAGARVSYH